MCDCNKNLFSNDIDIVLKKINKNEKITESELIEMLENIKISIIKHNNEFDEKYDDKFFNDQLMFLNNIKKWNNTINDFNCDSIVCFSPDV